MLRPEFGVSPAQPRMFLRPPPATAIRLIQDVWRQNKRNADIVLAVDTSASMAGEKIRGAEAAAKAFIDLLGPGDSLSALIFGAKVEWMSRDIRMGPQGKEQAKRSIDHLIATGNTALYEAIDEAYQFLLARDPSRTRALIVLSDGKDIKPSPSLEKLFDKLDRANRSGGSILVFTILYGNDADPEALRARQADERKILQGVAKLPRDREKGKHRQHSQGLHRSGYILLNRHARGRRACIMP